MGRRRLTPSPPENVAWVVDYIDGAGEEKKLELKLRVFNSADAGRVHAEAGADWADAIVTATNVELAIELLAAQIENADEVLAELGEDDLVEGLKRCIPLQEGVLEGLMEQLVLLYNIAVNGEAGRAAAKKKRRRRRLFLLIGLIGLLLGSLALPMALLL